MQVWYVTYIQRYDIFFYVRRCTFIVNKASKCFWRILVCICIYLHTDISMFYSRFLAYKKHTQHAVIRCAHSPTKRGYSVSTTRSPHCGERSSSTFYQIIFHSIHALHMSYVLCNRHHILLYIHNELHFIYMRSQAIHILVRVHTAYSVRVFILYV